MSEQDSPGRPPVADDKVPAGYVDVGENLSGIEDDRLREYVSRAISEGWLSRPYFRLGSVYFIEKGDLQGLRGTHGLISWVAIKAGRKAAASFIEFGNALEAIVGGEAAADLIRPIRDALAEVRASDDDAEWFAAINEDCK